MYSQLLVGRGQMRVLEKRIEQRQKINRFYREQLAHLPGLELLTEPSEEFFSNHWLTCITIDPKLSNGVTREDIRLALIKENIDCRPLWKPMHMQPVFKKYPFYGDGTSEDLFNKGLCLPSGSNLKEEELGRVVNVIKERF